MDYGKLFTRAWNIVWSNLWLILLGILAGLTASNTSSTSNYRVDDSDLSNSFNNMPFSQDFDALSGVVISVIIGAMCIGLIVGIIIYILSQTARGGLVAGVNTIESGETATLRSAWIAGWQRKWTLAGIGLVLAIPVVIFMLVIFGIMLAAFGTALFSDITALSSGDLAPIRSMAFGGLTALALALCCLMIPFLLVFGVWTELAYRACMIEGKGVFDSFGRGWRVLRNNLGPVIIIVLSRFAIGIVLILPTFISSLLCCLWPALIIINGAVTTYFSTVWTLAWREWTGIAPEESPLRMYDAA